MNLKDTIPMMGSQNYDDQFRAEYFQLKIRLERYEKLYSIWDEIDNIPFPKEILRMQLETMGRYLGLLEARAVIEEININEL